MRDQRRLAVDCDGLGNFDTAKIQRDHQGRDNRKFDGRNAAPVARKAADLT